MLRTALDSLQPYNNNQGLLLIIGTGLALYHIMMPPRNKLFETNVGKGKNAGNNHYLLFFPHNVFHPVINKKKKIVILTILK